jgi:hypothetical protein
MTHSCATLASATPHRQTPWASTLKQPVACRQPDTAAELCRRSTPLLVGSKAAAGPSPCHQRHARSDACRRLLGADQGTNHELPVGRWNGYIVGWGTTRSHPAQQNQQDTAAHACAAAATAPPAGGGPHLTCIRSSRTQAQHSMAHKTRPTTAQHAQQAHAVVSPLVCAVLCMLRCAARRRQRSTAGRSGRCVTHGPPMHARPRQPQVMDCAVTPHPVTGDCVCGDKEQRAEARVLRPAPHSKTSHTAKPPCCAADVTGWYGTHPDLPHGSTHQTTNHAPSRRQAPAWEGRQGVAVGPGWVHAGRHVTPVPAHQPPQHIWMQQTGRHNRATAAAGICMWRSQQTCTIRNTEQQTTHMTCCCCWWWWWCGAGPTKRQQPAQLAPQCPAGTV